MINLDMVSCPMCMFLQNKQNMCKNVSESSVCGGSFDVNNQMSESSIKPRDQKEACGVVESFFTSSFASLSKAILNQPWFEFELPGFLMILCFQMFGGSVS